MNNYLKDQAIADALAKSLLPDDEMRHLVSCSAPIPAGKNHEFLTLREEIVVKSIRRATAKAAGVRIDALESEKSELLAVLQLVNFNLGVDGYGADLEDGEDLTIDKVRAVIAKATGSAA